MNEALDLGTNFGRNNGILKACVQVIQEFLVSVGNGELRHGSVFGQVRNIGADDREAEAGIDVKL